MKSIKRFLALTLTLGVLPLYVTGCANWGSSLTELPSARKSFYLAGEAVSISSEQNPTGLWVITSEEMKTLMKY